MNGIRVKGVVRTVTCPFVLFKLTWAVIEIYKMLFKISHFSSLKTISMKLCRAILNRYLRVPIKFLFCSVQVCGWDCKMFRCLTCSGLCMVVVCSDGDGVFSADLGNLQPASSGCSGMRFLWRVLPATNTRQVAVYTWSRMKALGLLVVCLGPILAETYSFRLT